MAGGLGSVGLLARLGLFAIFLSVVSGEDAAAAAEGEAAAADKATEDAKGGKDKDLGDDLDLDDIDEEAEEPGAGGAPGANPQADLPESDFDLGMPPEDRKKRMKACHYLTLGFAQKQQEGLMEAIKSMPQVQSGQITREQAVNSIAMTWIVNCYHNIDAGGMAVAQNKGALTEQEEKEIFYQMSQKVKPSESQWKLISEVVEEDQAEAKRLEEEARKARKAAPRPRPRTSPTPSPSAKSSKSGGGTSVSFVLAAFAIIFGLAGLVVWRLRSLESDDDEEERSAKSRKKSLKAEKKLAKKRM